jgi:hypothetical protein
MKPSWDEAPEWANYLAQDYNGEWYWYNAKPTYNPYLTHWFLTYPYGGTKRQLYVPDPNPNWKDTLEEKP